MKYIIKLIIVVSLFASCSGKTSVNGIVYSKHGLPVPNGIIILNETDNPHTDGNDITVAITNNNGYYHFVFKNKFKKQYWVRCQSDSGLALGVLVRDKKTNTINLDTYYK